MKKGIIPSQEECRRLMNQYRMLDHIVQHSFEVMKVALFLSRELNRRGQEIDLDLVRAASLLHDIAKTVCLQTGEDHAVSGSRLLEELGYERLAAVVAQHIRIEAKPDPSCVTEEEVVNYADKRIQHDRIVSLEERFRDLRERYGRGLQSFRKLDDLEKATYDIERKIFSILDMDPNDVETLC